MMILNPAISSPVQIIGTLVLLISLYFAVRFFSGKRRRDAVRMLQKYFNNTVCPRSEFAPHLRELPLNNGLMRAGKLPKEGPLCPEEWAAHVSEERNSTYYLRTGQQISSQAAMEPVGSWYGLEAWIRDLLASRCDLFCADTAPKAGPESGEASASSWETTSENPPGT